MGIYVSWKVSVRPSGAGLRNVYFLICQLVLDINCQHLGSTCQLEGFCAPFGRRVRVISLARNLSGGKLSPWNLSIELLFHPGTCPGGCCLVWNLFTDYKMYIHTPTLRPQGAQKPSNLHIFPNSWQDISNTN